jgi:DNA polymerase I
LRNWSLTPISEESLWGWDPTPGIVSVWAEPDGRATVWRRERGALLRERERFNPWLLLDRLDDLQHLGDRLQPVVAEDATRTTGPNAVAVWFRELSGDGALRFIVSARDARTLK